MRFTRQFTLGWMMTISRLGHLGKKKKEGVDEEWYALQCEVRVSYGIRCQVSGLRSQVSAVDMRKKLLSVFTYESRHTH